MTKELVKIETPFNHKMFGDLTVFTHQDGTIWFLGKEIADKLEYVRPSDAITQHCKHPIKHRVKLEQRDTRGNDMFLINEYDLYRLVMRSNMSNAVEFQDWVVEEVLPSIRKTGKYDAQVKPKVETKPKSKPSPLSLKLTLEMLKEMNLSPESRQAVMAHLVARHEDVPVGLMLPVMSEVFLSPTQIGEKYGVSAQRVGLTITALGLKDKSADDGWFKVILNKSAHSEKQMQSYLYDKRSVQLIGKFLLDNGYVADDYGDL